MRFNPFRRKHRHRPALARLCTAALITMTLLSLIMPLVDSASAQTDNVQCDPGSTWSIEQRMCVPLLPEQADPIETPEPTEAAEPTAEPTEEEPPAEETEDPAVEGDDAPVDDSSDDASLARKSATISIAKHVCPAGYDASAEDYYDLSLNCHEDANGIGFGVSDGFMEFTGTTGTNGDGMVLFEGLPPTGLAIYEKPGAIETTSVIFCDGMMPGDTGPASFQKMSETEENQVFYILQDKETLYCDWFNVPVDAVPMDTVSIQITKHLCPDGYDASAESYPDLALNCQEDANGIPFGVSDGASEIATGMTGDAGDNTVLFENLPTGALSIYEKPGQFETSSIIFCAGMLPTNPDPANFEKMTETEEGQIFYTFAENETLYCDWYNVPATDDPGDGTPTGEGTPTAEGYGDITIYKWLCPEGYDPTRLGADAPSECTEPMDGVTFTLERPAAGPLQSNTGDSIPGAVTFGSQESGSYTITETLPDGIESAFIWDCVGGSTPQVHPTPLNSGATFAFDLADGDALTCNWYNVPETTGTASGSIILNKYICSGPEYTSDVDCEIYEEGQEFNLLGWAGSGWTLMENGTTDATGMIEWSKLNPGSYVIQEIDGEPCYITSTYQDGEEHILVAGDTETVVNVYNCTAEGETPVTGEPPVTYPNTGVAPASILSSLATPACAEVSAPNARMDEATPTAEEPTSTACPRGEVPVAISIESIDVAADIEVLETVNGTMQAPTTAEVVSWYKETPRLGEAGNAVLAGHLNYWGVPEGVFFDLAELEEGDLITITGDRGGLYRYRVTSVEDLPISEGPDEALTAGDGETITLITCGGEWDPSASEYQSRTVVKAERVS
jgi:sortase (surface protein transpeptidase)